MKYQQILDKTYSQISSIENLGNIASYIPELENVDPSMFGVCLNTLKHGQYELGSSNEPFSIQSIAKVFSLCLAYRILDDKTWQRLGVEPSGNPFNSLVQLETDSGIPRNPFINSGAIVICDILVSQYEDPKKELLEFIRSLSGNSAIDFCKKVADSEKISGFRNVALANFIKSFGNLHNEIDEVLDLYFNLCSIKMDCRTLSQSFLFLANHGINPLNGEKIITKSQCKRINAIMQTCGFYDEAGDFAFRVGLPGKSGVGGGIVAVHPNKYSIAVWSPKLNTKGNSFLGMKFLEAFTTNTKLSIF
jgi:glutaminase